jgi:hypothetical protein
MGAPFFPAFKSNHGRAALLHRPNFPAAWRITEGGMDDAIPAPKKSLQRQFEQKYDVKTVLGLQLKKTPQNRG